MGYIYKTIIFNKEGFKESFFNLSNKAPGKIEGNFSQLIYQVCFNVNVYGSVPGECPTPLFVAAEATDQIGVLHLVVKVADKSSPSHMRRSDIGNAFLFYLAGCGVNHRYIPGNTARFKNLFVVFILAF